MKKGYVIGLFFVCAVMIALIAALMWKRHNIEEFPNKNLSHGQQDEKTSEGADIEEREKESARETNPNGAGVSQAQSMNMVTTKDTMCIYENIDKKDGTVSMKEERLPARYVGLSRAELEIALNEDSQSMSQDEEGGFQSQHLELFSPEKIKILRVYDTTEAAQGYYIMEVEGEIRIYKEDKETLYFRTGLLLQDLPEDVQQEIIDGKYMESELKVYHFLESYSS